MISTIEIEGVKSQLNQLYKDAEYWFTAAELDILDGTYFSTDPTKEKIPHKIRTHNKQVKRDNFISAKDKITKIKNEYLSTLKLIILEINFEERKRLMSVRYKIEKMIKSCDHYVEIFS